MKILCFNFFLPSAIVLILVLLTVTGHGSPVNNGDQQLDDSDEDYLEELLGHLNSSMTETTTGNPVDDESTYRLVFVGETTMSPPNTEFSYNVNGYTIKSSGISNLDLHTSNDDGELVVKADIGQGGSVQMQGTTDEILLQVLNQDQNESNPWILIHPPNDVDIGLVRWRRTGTTIVISGPFSNTDGITR